VPKENRVILLIPGGSKEDFPRSERGKGIVMDNARTRELIERSGNVLVFLSPYSPDLNPMERFGGWLKRKIRSLMSTLPSLNEVLKYAFTRWN
jgi:transposase